MTTIVLTVSRLDFLNKVISSIELLECDPEQTNLLAVVDGDNQLYVRTRNMVNETKFKNRLTVKHDMPGLPSRYTVKERRKRIAFAHNQARELINHEHGYIFSVEDDTIFSSNTLRRLTKVALDRRAFASVVGVELGRWGIPYVGAWMIDDIYEPKQLTSIDNKYNLSSEEVDEIDAGGLYCTLIRADLYKQHEFTSANGLGPDLNFGIEARQLGFQNFIVWNVGCRHLNKRGIETEIILPSEKSKTVKITLDHRNKWHVSS